MTKTRILIKKTPELVEKEVILKGWINARRDMGKISFIDLRDRSAVAQVVLVPQELGKSADLVKELRPEYIVEIKGVVKARGEKQLNKDMPTGTVEIFS